VLYQIFDAGRSEDDGGGGRVSPSQQPPERASPIRARGASQFTMRIILKIRPLCAYRRSPLDSYVAKDMQKKYQQERTERLEAAAAEAAAGALECVLRDVLQRGGSHRSVHHTDLFTD